MGGFHVFLLVVNAMLLAFNLKNSWDERNFSAVGAWSVACFWMFAYFFILYLYY